MLWIAFRLYLWHIGHNAVGMMLLYLNVVNCFQIVSLTYWSQLINQGSARSSVVNCFQIVSLTYWSQPCWDNIRQLPCCELLSDCIFDILVTTDIRARYTATTLWIAFRLYLWHIGHNHSMLMVRLLIVVNCFQIVSLTYWSQLDLRRRRRSASCELLSDCIFDILVTTQGYKSRRTTKLWIAFRLYLWHIGHNSFVQVCRHCTVVNCFQIVSLTYWSQPFTIK